MGHIFISYSRHDKEYALRLNTALEENGFETWIDNHIETGQRWSKNIFKAIRNCAAFIVIMTPEADESEWVETEIHNARHLKKEIFPLLLREEVFPLLMALQYEDVSQGNLPSEKFFQRLGKAVESANKPQLSPEEELRTLRVYVEELEEKLDELQWEIERRKKLDKQEEYTQLWADGIYDSRKDG